jgi:REP element-mobilizing transposase RayT
MSAVTAIYHIVINTYQRKMTLPLESCDQLYNYIARVIQNHNSILFVVNGIENHIHLLIHLHPSVCLSDLVRDIKLASSQWMKQHKDLFPQFAGWGKEYGAFTYALRDKEMVANYISNQRAHHQRESFEDEYRKHLEHAGLEWNDYRLT